MTTLIPKTARGKLGFVSVIVYIVLMNWPIMKWAYSLQKPPDVVYVFGFPFAIFWATAACIVMLVIWAYTMLTVGEELANKVDLNEEVHKLVEE